MDATQAISDSFLESDEEEYEEERRPLAKLCILKNEHIPETELPLFLGENVLGRDSNFCTLPLPAPSVSKQHATICISVYRRRGFHDEEIEALVWDLGSMNGTRKGRTKLTPNVRYALSERDNLVVADIPCQYVSCAVDTVSSQGDSRTIVSRNSGVKARLPDALGEEGGDTSTGSTTRVNGGTEALPELEDTTKTPVRTGCLSFAPTPTQPEGTLVPESDVDSDGERGGGADRRFKTLVSDSDSHKSSPSSTFLSPTNKTIPESEDESPITPSSAKNRSHKRVSFSMDETDVDVGRQQLKEKKALVIADDSEEEEDRDEERATLKSEESSQHVPVKQERNVSLTGEDKSPVSKPALLTDAIPAFNMDSDTDVEGEEEGVASAGPVTLQTDQQADQPPNTAQFHMDSDTDVDEDDGASDKVPKPVPSSADNAKPPHVISVIQPEAITMDSDTDVDDDAAVSDAASKAQPVSFQSARTADSAPSTQLKDFHLDSDTDVDEEEEKECGTMNTSSKIDETPSRLDIEPIGPEAAPAAQHSLHSDSDTDNEAIPAPAVSEPSAVSESGTTADKEADLDILSDSDTDVEADSPLVVPFVVTTLSFAPDVTSEALQSESDADTDVDESSVPPAGDAVNPANLSASSNTKVEDEVDFGGAGEGRIPSLRRESTPGMLAPPRQNCSTPLQSSGGQVEDMDTQAFLGPSSGPFRYAGAPAERLKALSSCSESQEDHDFAVDETQSFVLQTNAPEDRTKDSTHVFGLESSGDEKGEQSTRGGSFHLGLSDSSHLQGQTQALAMESTQAFVSADRGVNLESTQAYAAILNAEITSPENDSHLEATQAYGEDEKPAGCPVTSEKESQVDLALQATQAYISEPCSDSEDETDENERKDEASAETQPLDFPTSSTLAMAETQLMSGFKEEESVSSVLQVKPRPQSQTEEKEEHGEAAHPQSVAETQPMHASDNEETDDEDLILCPRKRKAKLLHVEEEQTQPLTSCETQPMATSGNEESDEEGSIPSPQKRKAKQLCIEEEQTQTLTNSELSAAGTQPMDPGKDGESDEEDSIPGPRKRKRKPLQLEDEQTQPLTRSELSTVETQPMDACEGEQSDEEDSFPGPQKRKAKPLNPEEEQTQSLTISQVSAVETQPMVTGEDAESSEEDSTPVPRKRKARPLQIQEEETQPLTNSEASTVQAQPLETKADLQPEREQPEAVTSGVTVRGKRGTRARLREEEQAECSEPPKRQTRGKNKALPTTRGRRGNSRPDEDESEEEEEAKRTRGKNTTRQQKVDQEENLERERKEKEEQERVQAENAERLRLEQETAEQERIEKERKEREEKERADRIQKEKEEQLDRERKEKEEKERLEREKAEREEKERLEREEKARIEKERKEQEEKERLETAKRELEERLEREAKEKEARERLEKEKQEKEAKEKQIKEHQERLEREAKERERLEKEKQEKEAKEKQIKEQQENKPEAAARGRRAARRTTATTERKQDEQDDDVPARRTRSRSNSSNSVSSERSAASVTTQESSRGRGRGKGAKRTSEPPQAATARSSNRRRTVAAGPPEEDSNDISPQRVLSRSNSNNSLNSEISSCSLSSQSGRGRGGRQRGRGRKTETHSIPPNNSQSAENSAPKPTARGRKSRKAEESSDVVPHEDDKEKADSQQATTTRGRQRANASDSKPATADEEDPSNQEEGCANEEKKLPPKRNVRGRGQKAVKSETVEAAPAVSDGGEAKEKRKGRKRELEADTEDDTSSSSKIPKGKEKEEEAQTTEEAKGESKDEIPVQADRRGRASCGRVKDAKDTPTEVEMKGDSEKMEEEGAVERRGRGRPSAVQKKKKEEQEESQKSVDQDAHAEASEPQTPTSRASRKRQAPPGSSDSPKTPRSSSASPAAKGRSRPAGQTYKVLFTGVVDEGGERVLTHLGGSIAKGVADMNFLVTDKVRRTLKFLCAVAKGVPIVTTHWLEKSGKAGSFLPPNAFVVKDPEQERKFNFCLQDSLRIASSQPLLQGYEIHVTKSVKPEPDQMKDIITCSGAIFLSKMPSSHKAQTVVISCEEDWSLCAPALSASLPVVTAEFILTGILQQKLDFQTHSLSAPANTSQPAGGRGRGRKK